MLSYYLTNALRSMRRNPALTTLVALAIAIGIGVSMTMTTIYYLMASNPIPGKSEVLFRVQLDSWDPLRPFDADRPERAPIQMTWRDTTALLAAAQARHQVGMFQSQLIIRPANEQLLPFEASARVTSADFFPMFEPPFLFGSGWDRASDDSLAQVVVLGREINDRLFGGSDSVGRTVTINERQFTVVGVLDTWEPMPRFYDVVESGLEEVEEVFIPLALAPVLELDSSGSDWGWKAETIRSYADYLNSESCWLQYWAELPTRQDQEAYMAHLDAYALEQKKLGRFQRPLNNQIHDVMAWMAYNEVVERDVRVLVGLGFLFLVVCLLSSISLLLTKFNGRAGEMSLRRALGATRLNVISQNLVEVGIIGTAGGILGVLMTWASLAGLHSMISRAPEALFRMDGVLVFGAVAIAILTSLLAGLYPAVRACAMTPAQQLKTQ
ncbi:MAG: ABC transporter permease [Pseudomonadota bacterium]